MTERMIKSGLLVGKLLLVAVLACYLVALISGACLLIAFRLDGLNYSDRQMAVYTTAYEDTFTMEKSLDSEFPHKAYRFSVAWNGQEESVLSFQAYPLGTDGVNWYRPLQESVTEDGDRVYSFAWGSVVIRDGELSWSLLDVNFAI